jgi:hypothetical protein
MPSRRHSSDLSGTCHLCGGKIKPNHDISWDRESQTLTGHGMQIIIPGYQAALFDALWSAKKRGIRLSRERLHIRMYGHRHDGGPLSDTAIAAVQVHLNKKLVPFGLRSWDGQLREIEKPSCRSSTPKTKSTARS